ncbi:lysostaphin resistance A-like protein [Hymenobacter tenuis]
MKPAPAYPALKESWTFIGWYLLVTLLVGLPTSLLASKVLHLSKSVTGMVVAVLSNVALLGFMRWKAGKRWNPVQFTGQEQGWLYALLPLLVPALVMVLSVVQLLGLPDWQQRFFEELVHEPVAAFLVGVVAVPILEEVLFRGVILQALLRTYRPWVAIGQSALLFGIIHFNPAQSLGTALIGVVLGWLYYRTRSLWLCISIHALNNLLAFASMIWPVGMAADSPEILLATSPGLYIGLVLLSALVLFLVLRRVQQTTSPVPMPEVLPTEEEPLLSVRA